MSNQEAVRQILEREGKAMRVKEIAEPAREFGLHEGQVGGALYHLKQDGIVENVEWGAYRIVAAPKPSRKQTPAAPLDVTGLSSKEAVLRILAHTDKPMRHRHIVKWLEDNGQSLTDGQIAGALYVLWKKLEAVEPVSRGLYRIRKDWEDGPLDFDEQADKRDLPPLPKEPKGRIVIPCYGLHWKRSSVSWNAGAELLGAMGPSEDAVNFANQTGVYVLYLWPQVTYVGRTAKGGLYQRLRSHDGDASKEWDTFSWFGLGAVDEEGVLCPPSARASIEDQVTMMEAVLIGVLRPPFNNKQGDMMGDQYGQVPDPIVEERELKVFRERLRKLIP